MASLARPHKEGGMKAQLLEDRSLAQVEAGVHDLAAAFSAILADSALLGRFLRACAILKGLDTQARAAAIRLLEQGESIPGAEYHPGRVTTTVSAEAILEAAESNGRALENLRVFVYLVAPISGSRYSDFCRKIGATAHRDRIHEKTAAPYIVVEKPHLLKRLASEEVGP
jgi:hypothetical protein